MSIGTIPADSFVKHIEITSLIGGPNPNLLVFPSKISFLNSKKDRKAILVPQILSKHVDPGVSYWVTLSRCIGTLR